MRFVREHEVDVKSICLKILIFLNLILSYVCIFNMLGVL